MRSFIGFGQKAYIGIPQAQSIKLASISAAIVPLLFQWLSYQASTANTNVNVLCDLRTKECTKLDQIRSVYIDNLGSSVPVYVYFPDTGYTCVAKPNSEGWYPAFTNDKLFWVVGEGFLDGSIPQTSVIVCNAPIFPNVNEEIDNAVALWLASPVITRGNSIYNRSFGIPALGDQLFFSDALALTAGPTTVGMWNTPYASGFLYIRSLKIWATGASAAAATPAVYVTESTGVAGTLFKQFWVPPLTPPSAAFPQLPGVLTLIDLEDMQLKLDATQTWRMQNQNTITSGNIYAISAFTQTDQ